jgi:hypothetical protein
VNNIAGESVKPWLGGETQPKGIVGVGTYKRKTAEENASANGNNVQDTAV